ERYGGNHGNNIASDINAYINGCTKGVGANNPCDASTFPGTTLPAHKEGFDSSIGNYVTMHVFLWQYAESNLDPTPGVDLGKSLTNGATGNTDRVILDRIECFRFGDGTGTAKNVLDSSDVRGYWVSCPSSTPSGNGPPSTAANAVRLVA